MVIWQEGDVHTDAAAIILPLVYCQEKSRQFLSYFVLETLNSKKTWSFQPRPPLCRHTSQIRIVRAQELDAWEAVDWWNQDGWLILSEEWNWAWRRKSYYDDIFRH